METNYFYKKFLKKGDAELEVILNNPKSYDEVAVLAAGQILKDRKVQLTEEQISAILKIEEKREVENKIKEEREMQSEISPFAKRIIALVIDLLILSAISYLIGFILIGTPLIKDPWEPLLSWLIIMGYFVTLNSKIGSGTVGKQAMEIKVENYRYQSISLTESAIRYSLLVTPYFLLSYLDTLPFNSFGILIGLRYSYYVAIVYFIVSDKKLRRSYHDLISKTFIKTEDQSIDSFEISKKRTRIFYFIALGIVALFVTVNLSVRSSLVETSEFQRQTEDLRSTLNENISTFKLMVSDIQKIDGVAEIEGIDVNTTNGVTSLDITVRPSFFSRNDKLTEEIYASLKGKKLKISRLDNVKIIKHYGLDLTLAIFNRTETTNFEQ